MTRARSRLPLVVGACAGLVLTSTMVVRTTQAVFSGTTSTPSNSFATGSVKLTNSSVGTAAFTDNSLNGGTVLTRCIQVTYTGTLTATGIRLYGTSTGALASSLQLKVEQGTGTVGASAACSSFTAQSTIFGSSGTATLADFSTQTANTYATGVGSWTGAVANDTKVYRFTVTVPNNAPQDSNASGVFTWEAQG